MDDRLGPLVKGLERNPPCDPAVLGQLPTILGCEPPADYVAFLRQWNGGEGPIGDNGYVSLWKVEDIAPSNEEYGSQEFTPGLVLFASDGGGTAYAFDTRQEPVRIVAVPFISIDLADVEPISQSFVEFLEYLAHQE